MIGTVINNYRVLDELARGGMGVVYRAEHVSMGQRAVVKQLLPQYTTHPEVVARFFQEARAAASIDDPGIVKMFDQGTLPDGSAYITMELLAGESLAARLHRGPLPPDEAIAMVRQAARVLAAAHARRIVHRDLKPDNLFLVPDPDVSGGMRIKVLDFGIAKLMDAEATGGGGRTRAGMSMGTPDYMAPEQWRSAAEVDGRADVYALGCILYAALVGRPPFPGPGLPELMDQHRFAPPPLPSAVDAALAPFDPIVARSLAKAPDDRYLTMEALAGALAALASPSLAGVGVPSAAASTVSLRGAGSAPGTTLGGAAAEVTPVAAKGSGRRGLLYGLAGGAGVVVVVFALLVIAGPPDEPGQPPAAAAATPTAAADPTPPPAAAGEPVKPAPAGPEPGWVRIEPPRQRVRLGLAAQPDGIPDDVYGFRPEAEVYAPAEPYEIQAKEVTWGELEAWLARCPDCAARLQGALPLLALDQAAERRDLPVTELPFIVAVAYCAEAQHARLPTEEEWEYAARGEERRPYPWGDAPLDPARTRACVGPDQPLVAVGTSPQDITPTGIHDLLGNAQEWTGAGWREDDEAQAPPAQLDSDDPKVVRPVRGVPHDLELSEIPAEGAAFRDHVCSGNCSREWDNQVRFVGFRCARPAR